jgi:hypothetical protein
MHSIRTQEDVIKFLKIYEDKVSNNGCCAGGVDLTICLNLMS